MVVTMSERRAESAWVGPACTAAGAALVLVAAFLPWIHTGARTRDSFHLMRTAELLDVVTGAATFALRAWYLVPALVALVWLAAALDRRRLMAALAAVLVVVTAAAAIVVLRSGVPVARGPDLALLASAVTAAGLVLTIRSDRRLP
jgi:hypothetical protein